MTSVHLPLPVCDNGFPTNEKKKKKKNNNKKKQKKQQKKTKKTKKKTKTKQKKTTTKNQHTHHKINQPGSTGHLCSPINRLKAQFISLLIFRCRGYRATKSDVMRIIAFNTL